MSDKGNEQTICQICEKPVGILVLSPKPCTGCGKHFCIDCRAQTEDDRCFQCYPLVLCRPREEEPPLDEQHYPAGKTPSALPSKPRLRLPKLPEEGTVHFPPLDFDQGRVYRESMRQTDFGDTAIKQIAKLALFFKEKLPGEQHSGESIVDTAIRLLSHYTHE